MQGYGQWDFGGGFIMFTEGSLLKVFNVPDAGNFLFGVAANRMGITNTSLVLGSQSNELFSDSPADQRAILSGWYHANKIRAYQSSTYFGFGSWFDYETSKPSWFKKETSGLDLGRRR